MTLVMGPARRPCVAAAIVALCVAGVWAPTVSTAADHPPVPAGVSGVVASDTCLGCHDGTLARDVRANVTRGVARPGAASAFEREAGHPIGTEYARAAANHRSRLRAVRDPGIALEQGRVGCVSCHDLGSPRPGRLAVTVGGSLCPGCHDL
jgi:predicted CXXCH cytochrome family protein